METEATESGNKELPSLLFLVCCQTEDRRRGGENLKDRVRRVSCWQMWLTYNSKH